MSTWSVLALVVLMLVLVGMVQAFWWPVSVSTRWWLDRFSRRDEALKKPKTPAPPCPPESLPTEKTPPPPEEEEPAEVETAPEGAYSPETYQSKGVKDMSDPLVKVQAVVGENTTQLLQESSFTLPIEAIKIRNVVAEVRDVVAEVISGKVIVQGVIHKQIFFVGTDNIVHHAVEEAPFSTFVEIPAAVPGNLVQVHPTVAHVRSILTGPRTVLQKVIIDIMVKVTEERQLSLVESPTGPLIRADEVVGENTVQVMEETPVTLLVPAIKVTDIAVTFQDLTSEVITDKVVVQGVIHKQIFFVNTDNVETHQAVDIPFSTIVDVPGAAPGMDVQLEVTLEAVRFELTSPTQLLEKVVFEVFAKVTQSIQFNVLAGVGPLLKLEQVRGEDTAQILQETTVTLSPAAIKVRDIVASVQSIVTEIIPNKVIVQGILHKQIFFIGTDNLEHHQIEDVPFSLFVEIPGAQPGMNVIVTPTVESVIFELLNETTLRQKVVLEVMVKVTETVQMAVTVLPGIPQVQDKEEKSEDREKTEVVQAN